MSLDNCFSCYLMSLLTLNIFVLRKDRRIFELCHYFIFFLSISGAASVKARKYQFRVSNTILLELVFYSTYFFFVLILRVLK